MSFSPPPFLLSEGSAGGEAAAFTARAITVLAPAERTKLEQATEIAKTLFADSLVHLLDLVASEERPLVLLQGGAIAEHDIELAARISDLPARPSVVVLGREEAMEQAITMARRLGLGCVFPADCLSRPEELARLVEWIDRGGPEPGLAPHLARGTKIVRRMVREKPDKAAVIDSVLEVAGAVNADRSFQFDVRLIMEELLNNAIYHAFLDAQGREKYKIGSFVKIAEGEEIAVNVGADSHTIGVAIVDNQGRLRRDTILNKLERHLSIQGLLDESGRGLYLTYSLAGRAIFNLRREKSTELIVLFPARAGAWTERSTGKPVLIFERS